MRALVVAIALAACGGPRFLGAPLPVECRSSYTACDALLRLRLLAVDRSVQPELERYVAGVLARVVRASTLRFMPGLVLMPVGEAAIYGRNVVVGVSMIVQLGSEAQLAGVLAHELVHLEAGRDETSTEGARVDEEAIADERAVELLVRAGYPAAAMKNALTRLYHDSPQDVPDHPPGAERIRRVTILADGRPDDDRTRPVYLAAIAGAPIGRDLRRGVAVAKTWVVADQAITVALPPGVELDRIDEQLGGHFHAHRYSAWRVDRALVREVADNLVVAERRELPIGHVAIGTGRNQAPVIGSSLDRLLAERHVDVVKIDPDEIGALIETPSGAIAIAIRNGTHDMLERWLGTVRAPTAAELAAAVTPRLVFVQARRTATVRELVTACVDPTGALTLDDPDRVIRAGESFKCTDRVVPADVTAQGRPREH